MTTSARTAGWRISRTGGTGFYLLTIAMLGGGIWAHAHYGPISDLCQATALYGSSEDSQCTVATSIAPFAIPTAVIGGIGLALMILLSLFGHVATSRSTDGLVATAVAAAGTDTYICDRVRCRLFGQPTNEATCRACRRFNLWLPHLESSVDGVDDAETQPELAVPTTVRRPAKSRRSGSRKLN